LYKVQNMKLRASIFQQQLEHELKDLIHTVNQQVSPHSAKFLNTPEGPGKWSILQCVEHLSLANQVYVKNIANCLASSQEELKDYEFQSHWKGDLFTKRIAPRSNQEIKGKMKTFKSMEPSEVLDPQETLDKFNRVHEKLLSQLRSAKAYNMNTVKVPTALGSMVKLRLGDAFRFLIAHSQRHLVQIKRIGHHLESAY